MFGAIYFGQAPLGGTATTTTSPPTPTLCLLSQNPYQTTYTVGDLINLTATFTDSTLTPINPTTVTITIRAPDGALTQTTPTLTAPGVYTTPQNLNQSGTWHWKAEGTGAAQGAAETEFYVQAEQA